MFSLVDWCFRGSLAGLLVGWLVGAYRSGNIFAGMEVELENTDSD